MDIESLKMDEKKLQNRIETLIAEEKKAKRKAKIKSEFKNLFFNVEILLAFLMFVAFIAWVASWMR